MTSQWYRLYHNSFNVLGEQSLLFQSPRNEACAAFTRMTFSERLFSEAAPAEGTRTLFDLVAPRQEETSKGPKSGHSWTLVLLFPVLATPAKAHQGHCCAPGLSSLKVYGACNVKMHEFQGPCLSLEAAFDQ